MHAGTPGGCLNVRALSMRARVCWHHLLLRGSVASARLQHNYVACVPVSRARPPHQLSDRLAHTHTHTHTHTHRAHLTALAPPDHHRCSCCCYAAPLLQLPDHLVRQGPPPRPVALNTRCIRAPNHKDAQAAVALGAVNAWCVCVCVCVRVCVCVCVRAQHAQDTRASDVFWGVPRAVTRGSAACA
jgi:hypothetical protein